MRWRSLWERVDGVRLARLRGVIFVLVTLVLTGLIAHPNQAASGDPVHYMVVARSLAFDRDFDVGNDYRDPANIIQEPAGSHAQVGRNGILRPVHDVGLPLVAAPFFGVAYALAQMTDRLPISLREEARLNPFIALRSLVSVLMILLTAGLAVAFFDVSRHVTGETGLACAWALVWALSPPILAHGYVFFTEIPSALVALLAYSMRDVVRGERANTRGLAVGLLTGLLLLIHVRNVGLVLALVLLIGWRVRFEPRRGMGVLLGLALMMVVKVTLNLRFWGTVLTTPHEQFGEWPGTMAFLLEVSSRSFGLLFDERHGLLPSAPIYLLAPAAWFLLRRRSSVRANELLLLVVAYLIFVVMPVTNTHGWRGGWSPAARFLVPIAPFLALAVPLLLRQLTTLRTLMVVVLLCVQLPLNVFFWKHPMLLWSEGPGLAPWLDRLIGGVS